MELTWDEEKRQRTVRERGLDFADCRSVFAGKFVELEDQRFEYSERRMLAFGMLGDRIVVIVSTHRDGNRRIISMRHANERERKKIAPNLGRS